MLQVLQIALKALSNELTIVELVRSKFISESPQSKLNSDSSRKKMILKHNLDVLVPKYVQTISFVFRFLEQMQTADWGVVVLGSWVDVISNRRPQLPKTRSAIFKRAVRKSTEIRGFNQIYFFAYILRITSGFILAKKIGS